MAGFLFSLVFSIKIATLFYDFGGYHSYFALLSLLIYCFICFCLYKIHTTEVLVFSWMLIYLSSSILAASIIDIRSDFYLFEVKEYTYPSSTTISLCIMVLSSLFFMMLPYTFFSRYKSRSNSSKTPMKVFFNGEVLSILILLLIISMFTIILYIDRPAFAMGMSKVVYSADVLNPTVDKLIRNSLVFVPAVGALACHTNKLLSRVSIVTLFLYIMSLVWIGHKFGLIFYVIYFSLLFYSMKAKSRDIRTALFYIIFAMAFLIGLVLFSVSIAFDIDFLGALDYLLNRIAQQSQVWFAMQRLSDFDDFHTSGFVNEIYTFGQVSLTDQLHSKVGIYKVMSLSMSYDDYLTRFYNGQNLAFGFYPLITYYFDFSIALFINALLSFVYGLFICLILYFVTNGFYFCSVLCARIIMMMHAVLIQGDLFRIVSLDNLIVFVVMLCLYIFQRKMRDNNSILRME